MGRILAIDWGERRLGLALSDERQVIASPLKVMVRGRVLEQDLETLLLLVRENEVERVVVGVPVRTDGRHGPEAARVMEAVERLRASLPVPVDVFDERFSSAEARRVLHEGEVSSRQMREKVDAIAASLFLQTYMDTEARKRRS